MLTDEGAKELLERCAQRLLRPVARQARSATSEGRTERLTTLYGELQMHVLAHLPVTSQNLVQTQLFTGSKFVEQE